MSQVFVSLQLMFPQSLCLKTSLSSFFLKTSSSTHVSSLLLSMPLGDPELNWLIQVTFFLSEAPCSFIPPLVLYLISDYPIEIRPYF